MRTEAEVWVDFPGRRSEDLGFGGVLFPLGDGGVDFAETPSNLSSHGSKPGGGSTWTERISPVSGFHETTALARAPPAEVPMRRMVGMASGNTQGGGPTITKDTRGLDRPTTGVSWNEAARFVNWLNTSSGFSAAYKFTTGGFNDPIALWEVGDAGYDASNPFRNANAHYYLPSEDEWYKAACYDPAASGSVVPATSVRRAAAAATPWPKAATWGSASQLFLSRPHSSCHFWV